jgi:hypothetical protein
MATTTPDPPRTRRRLDVPHAVALLIGAQALALWLLGRTSMWRTDDWIYFDDMAQRGRWSGDWLYSIWWKHIAPLHRAMFSLFEHGSPGTYTGALLFEIALVAIAAAAFYGILELLFGRSWWLLIPVAVFGFSFQFALPLVWPSSGFQAMPETAASVLCTYALLRRLRGGSFWWVVGGAVALGVGLCFYIRPLLVVPLLLALRYLFLEPSLRPRPILRSLWREKWTWAVLLAPVAIFVAVYLHRHAFGQRQPLNATDLQHYVREAWFRNVWPSMLGIRERAGSLSFPYLAAEVVAQLGLAALVALSLYRKGVAALRGWAFVAVAVALTFGLTATGKLAESGPAAIGLETRYTTNLTWLVPLGVMMALQPARVARLGAPWPSAAEAGLRPLPAWASRLGPVLAGAATVLASVLALLSANHVIAEWGARDGRPWVVRAIDSSQRLSAQRGGRPVHLPDARVPSAVLDNAFSGFARRGVVLPQTGAPILVGPPYDALQRDDGTVVAARTRRQATLSLAAYDGLATATGLARAGGCLAATGTTDGLLEWRLAQPVTGGAVIVALPDGTRLPADGLGVDVDSGFGFPPNPWKTIPGYGLPQIETGETKVVALRLHVRPGERLCAASVSLLSLDPAGA